ncbi:MAG: hypothetical protein FJ309_08135 [Planctomycetes bacterium]|nr:hypothetical protein [Planctomycetota bacterium]MBM4057431.1 hypothetical protein [Planctomycetota bacterium]
MFPLTRQWADDLARFVDDHRAARPARAVPMVAAEAAAHDAILVDHLRRFLDHDLAVLRRHRTALAERTDVDPDPVVVVMTNPWGLPATSRALLAVPPGSVIAVTELEFRYFSRWRPDEGHRHHVNHWSWIKRGLPEPRQAEFAWLGAPTDAVLWLHRSGTTGAGAGDGLVCAVHHWDGTRARLLTADAARRTPGGAP